MILSRSVSVLHFCGVSSAPKLLSQKFNVSFALTYGPCASFRFISLNRSDGKWVRGFASATEAEVERTETFFANSAVSWKSLGLSDKVSTALQNSGLGRTSLTQAVCIPSILSGKDVIVAAETGSGKTHGYLAPIIDGLTNTALDSERMNGEERPFQLKNLSLILCPNVTLCEQVVRMINGLLGEDGNPLLRVEAVCGSQGWPDRLPDIIVSTPAALLNNFEPKRHRRRLEFLRSVKYVVFDEADMLLCGSFQNQIIRLINMLRFDEKQVSRLATSKVGKPLEIDASIAEFDLENEEDAEFEDGSISEEEEEELEYRDDITQIPSVEAETGTGSEIQKNWRRVRKIYSRSKQYIFIAATLPVNGKKTAGGMLKYMFPDAIWVSGNFLHRNSPRLKQKWVEVTLDTQVNALIEAVSNCNNSTDRTMVFANTVDAVEAVANVLEEASIRCYRYHKNHALEERANILADFREKGGVFVCTDAAARGVDVPNVSHVIQADFASCAVDYVHRIGRTARAGQYGTVTSLYTEANSDLVEAIRQAVQTGQPVETAFSRRRGFRNKLKKSILKAREAEEPQDVRA